MSNLKISGNYTYIDENNFLNNKCINVDETNIENNKLMNHNNLNNIYVSDDEYNINKDINEDIHKNNYINKIFNKCIDKKHKINTSKITDIININNEDYLYSDEHIEYILLNNNNNNNNNNYNYDFNYSKKKNRRIIIISFIFFLKHIYNQMYSH